MASARHHVLPVLLLLALPLAAQKKTAPPTPQQAEDAVLLADVQAFDLWLKDYKTGAFRLVKNGAVDEAALQQVDERMGKLAKWNVIGAAKMLFEAASVEPVLLGAVEYPASSPYVVSVGGTSLLTWPRSLLHARLTRPDRGPFHEPLFDVLRAHGFEWERFVDYAPTLELRFDRLDEVNLLPAVLRRAAAPVLRWAEARGALRLDWFAGRGWRGGQGRTVHGFDGRGRASDHAPIVARFE